MRPPCNREFKTCFLSVLSFLSWCCLLVLTIAVVSSFLSSVRSSYSHSDLLLIQHQHQHHAPLITADGAYHCPLGSKRPFLAPWGAWIAILAYYWPSSSIHRSHRSSLTTFTFWATTAISKAITGLCCCWLQVYFMCTTGHHCEMLQDSAR